MKTELSFIPIGKKNKENFMKKILFFQFILFLLLSIYSLAENIENIIEVNLITKNSMKIYYISFSENTKSFNIYSEPY